MPEFKYHQNPAYLHNGCEKPHAYFIPYQSEAAANTTNRANSNYFYSLCGEWSFRYYDALHKVPNFLEANWEFAKGDRLPVPMSWQYALDRGYDTPHYINVNYPIPVDPPYVPVDNPCGLYERTFEVDGEVLANKKLYMVFVDDWYIDIMTANLVNPAIRNTFQVVVLPNLYGDIITDEAAQLQGGMGSAGSANIGDRYAMFEAIHGSAPRMLEEGLQDYVNPTSILRATVMLLRHICYQSAAQRLEKALDVCKINVTGNAEGATCENFMDCLQTLL